MRRRHVGADRGGFVLPVALVVLVLMALVSGAGLHAARSAYRAAAASRASAVALAAADAGAAWTLLRWTSVVPASPAPGDSVATAWRTLPDGSRYRSVIYAAPVGPDDAPSPMVLVRTTGEAPPPTPARRSVVTWAQPGVGGAPDLCCSSGFLVQSRLRVRGDRNDPIPEVDGRDRAPPGWPAARCTAPTTDIPGILTSDLGEVDVARDATVAGAPPLLEDPSLGPSDFTDFGSMSYADLAATADLRFVGNQRFRDEIRPQVSGGSCDTSSTTNWGAPLDPTGPCGDYFPMIHVAGDLQLQRTASGQGILLVDGDLDLDDDVRFDGLILVQGRIRIRDDARVHGAAAARGGDKGTDRSEIDDRGKLMYSSCAVEKAAGRFSAGATAATGRFWFEVVG